MRRLLRDRVATAALLVLGALVLLALLAPWLAPTDPADNDLSQAMALPGAGLWLGADDQGRDLVTRVLFGLRLTLLIGVTAVGLGGAVGALLGLLAAFYRRADGVIMRCMDVLLSFPAILFGLALAAILGPGVAAVVLALSIATVPLFARITRAAASVEMARDYIEAARATGLTDAGLIWRHLLPNCTSALLVFATLRFGQVILLGAALSFLGLGAQPPTAELGAMASQGRNFLFFAPHIAVIPCVAIVILVLACNVLGDALRDVLDPRSLGGTSMMRMVLAAALLTLAAPVYAQPAPPGTLVLLRTIDADNYDPARSTARSAGEVLNFLGDTLTTLDWDMKTVKPGLAKSWTVSPDGRLYTFKLRDDVSFCDGRKMTADDVVYTIKRFVDPATHSPVRWRAGPVKDVRATDPTTVEYELSDPFNELPLQLSLFFLTIVDKNAVDAMGPNFGVQGFNGTGPFCWASWTPRQEIVLKKHEGYNWGPPIFNNPAPQVDRVIWRVIPDANTILAAIQSGQGDATQYTPPIALPSLRNTPGITLSNQPNYFWDYFLGFKIDKPAVDDPVLRRAMVMAVNRDAIAKAVWFGAATPADSYLNPGVLDFDPKSKQDFPKFDPAAARKLLDDNGWAAGADGVRAKGGVRASFTLYGISDTLNNRAVEAIQADLKRIGVEMKVQMWDATVAWGKLATQEFGAFIMSYPYVSASEALNLYFNSSGAPTPNRMNWKNKQTDEWLLQARTATDDAVKHAALGSVQEQLTDASVWIPLVREQLWVVSGKRAHGVRAYGGYGIGIYKGLDITLTP